MRAAVLLASLLLAACGSRTALRVGHTDGDGGAPASCADTPWILFSYLDPPAATIYAMHADGSDLHALRLPSPRPFYPSVSPDGSTLAYVDIAPFGPLIGEIVLYDFATGAHDSVVGDVALSYPVLSPDGSQLAYVQGQDVHLAQRDGSGDHVLVAGPFAAGSCCLYGYSHPLFSSPSTVMFSTAGQLGSIATDGSGRNILLASDPTTYPYPNPTLSPDGTRIAALIACDGVSTQLRIYPLASLPAPCDSGTVTAAGFRATADVGVTPNPAWGPTDVIAFAQGSDVYVIPVTGGTPVNLTAGLTRGGSVVGGSSAGNPVWAPGCTALP